jgi:prepilin signal peptidase PulO-like enzyme (type II secretory pathway)
MEFILWGLLFCASVIDWRTLKIPNKLTVPGMICGLIFQGFFGLEGFFLALFLGGILTLLGFWGGGDAKLLMVVGAFIGPWKFYSVFVTVLILAAVVSFANAFRYGEIKAWFQGKSDIIRPIPLAPLIFIATLLAGR